MLKPSLLTLILMLFAVLLQAQGVPTKFTKSLSIRPMAQVTYVVSGFPKSQDTSEQAKLYKGSFTGTVGGLIDYRFSEKLMFTTGFYKSSIGYGIQIDAPKNLLRFSESLQLQSGASIYASCLPIHINYKLATVRLLGNKEKDNYLFRMKFQGLLGVNFTHYGENVYSQSINQISYIPKNSGGTSPHLPDFDVDDYISVKSSDVSLTHRNNVSLEIGLGIQFFNKLGSNGPRLDFLYSQGLITQHKIVLQYEINQSYTGIVNLRTKGSWFGLRLSQPICVKRWQ